MYAAAHSVGRHILGASLLILIGAAAAPLAYALAGRALASKIDQPIWLNRMNKLLALLLLLSDAYMLWDVVQVLSVKANAACKCDRPQGGVGWGLRLCWQQQFLPTRWWHADAGDEMAVHVALVEKASRIRGINGRGTAQ